MHIFTVNWGWCYSGINIELSKQAAFVEEWICQGSFINQDRFFLQRSLYIDLLRMKSIIRLLNSYTRIVPIIYLEIHLLNIQMIPTDLLYVPERLDPLHIHKEVKTYLALLHDLNLQQISQCACSVGSHLSDYAVE